MAPAEAVDFQEAGVVCVRNALAPEWIDLLISDLAKAESAPSPYAVDLAGDRAPGSDVTGSSYWGDFSLWERLPGYRQFVLDSPLASMVGAVVRSDRIQLFYDYLLVKQARSLASGSRSSATAWHQDYPYYPVEGTDICSVFVPLQATTLENGGLEYVTGSHKWGPSIDKAAFPEVRHRLSEEKRLELEAWEDTLNALPPVDERRSSFDIRSWDLRPGDVLIHHSLAVHGAPPNRMDIERVGYAVRMIYGAVSYAPRANPSRHLDALMADPAFPIPPGTAPSGPHFPVLWQR